MRYTVIVSDTDRRGGTVDIGAMLQKLQSMGIVSPNEYVASIELGAEVSHGSGSLVFNNTDVRVRTNGLNGPACKKAVTGMGVFDNYIQGGTGDYKLYAPVGAGLIDGGAGNDTVVFAGARADYTFTQNTDGTLTVAGAGRTTTLLNIQHISFIDRVLSTNRPATVAMDFNGDRSGDILRRNDDGQILVWNMRGGSVLSHAMLNTPGANWNIKATGDFDGDGATDLVLQSGSGQAILWFLKGNKIVYSGRAVTTPGTAIDNPGEGWEVAGSGDFNGDGTSDILWRNGNQLQIWMMNGNIISTARTLAGMGPQWRVAGIGDFNGDRKSDILWQDTNNNVQLWTMDGGSVQASASAGYLGAGMRVVATGDFDGDGKADLLTQVNNGPAGVWLMNGPQKRYAELVTDAGNAPLRRPGPNWIVAGSGDYYGDGKTDILWQSSTGALQVWTMNGKSARPCLLSAARAARHGTPSPARDQ